MLSVAINVKNGAKYLERCLNALSKFDDVVILDNYSTDNTCAIAVKYPNVRLFQGEFCGMGKLRNQAAAYAKYDWILRVDCDEVLHPQLTAKLLDMQHNAGFIANSVYQVKFYNYYNNFRVDGASWGNERILCLYNRQQTRWVEDGVHEKIMITGMVVRQIEAGFIYHFPYDNVAQLIDKMQFYSTLYAKQNYLKKRPKLYVIPLRALAMFIKCYILKRGFKYGYEGLIISMYNAIGVFSKYIKLYELGYQQKLALVVDGIQNLTHLHSLINAINQQTLLPYVAFVVVEGEMLATGGDSLESIAAILKENLVIPFKLIVRSNQDVTNIAAIVQGQLVDYPDLAVVIYPELSDMLVNPKVFKRCKQAVLKGDTICGVNFINTN